MTTFLDFFNFAKKRGAFIMILAAALSSALYATPQKKLARVGYFENEVFQEGAQKGSVKTGYAYEYYQKLSEYTGWKYEYVYGEFGDLYQMLLDGKIDFLAGLAWRADRAGIIGYPEPQSCIDRENGWMEVMNAKKDEYNLNIVNIGNYKGDAGTAEQLMQDALTSYPDMAVIFTVGDPACIGALAAIKAAGASTKMIGFDANPEAHEAILDETDGKIWVGDVAQDPYQIGYKIAEEMVKYLTEGTVDSDTILIAPYLVDASNAVKPE